MIKLFGIWVPCRNQNRKLFPHAHHKEWDAKASAITGGLTIDRSVKGKWLDGNKLISEKMVLVKIACSERQMELIADMTKKHYEQKLIMYYLISPEVYFI